MISTSLIVFTKQGLWVANYKDKKGIYIKKYKRKDLMWSRQNRGDFAPKSHEQYKVRNSHSHGLVRNSHLHEQYKVRNLPFWAPYTNGIYHYRHLICQQFQAGSEYGILERWFCTMNKIEPPKVTVHGYKNCFFPLFFLFAFLLYLACLNDPKSCQNTKTSHKYD